MTKTVCAGMLVALGLATSALAAPNGVVTPANQCNTARLQQMQLSIDAIRDPVRQEAASAELSMAVAMMQQNDTDGCLMHLTNASEYVLPQ